MTKIIQWEFFENLAIRCGECELNRINKIDRIYRIPQRAD